ncbi:MAG: hypothetical protein L0Y72_15035 [Gemmataceae bacterium]|nr:hypothetical protein [Gemmataceae bacterium]MCI0740358.1 hypothetical protein [Gemmataceae bacterium]
MAKEDVCSCRYDYNQLLASCQQKMEVFLMPRFVILEHDHPYLHWDFMLERDGVLRTWRLEKPPPQGLASETVAATSLGDHRLAYLDYEGPLTDERGSVKRWDAGTYDVVQWEQSAIVINLHGSRIIGPAQLEGRAWNFC